MTKETKKISLNDKIEFICEKYSLNLEVKKEILELCKEAYITGSNDCFNIWVKKEDKL